MSQKFLPQMKFNTLQNQKILSMTKDLLSLLQNTSVFHGIPSGDFSKNYVGETFQRLTKRVDHQKMMNKVTVITLVWLYIPKIEGYLIL